jgi:hypothetical protein
VYQPGEYANLRENAPEEFAHLHICTFAHLHISCVEINTQSKLVLFFHFINEDDERLRLCFPVCINDLFICRVNYFIDPFKKNVT